MACMPHCSLTQTAIGHTCPKQNAFAMMAVVLARMAAVEAVWLVELVVVVARFVVVVARKARMVQMAKVAG